MNGRVTRLFMTPLLRSLPVVVGRHPLLLHLDSFATRSPASSR